MSARNGSFSLSAICLEVIKNIKPPPSFLMVLMDFGVTCSEGITRSVSPSLLSSSKISMNFPSCRSFIASSIWFINSPPGNYGKKKLLK
jgi:hypothetical protein